MQTANKADDLIYDVGMHQGEDTQFYLNKGFRVVGFEANPELVALCQNRFAQSIADKRLTIVTGAILPATPGVPRPNTVTFYKSLDHSVWGTVMSDWAQRNQLLGAASETIEVPVIDFSDCLARFGIPHYMKIDIEGMDNVCLQALLEFQHKPDYISIEAQKVVFDELHAELELLSKLGYDRFKAVQQSGISLQLEPNPSREGQYTNHRFEEGSSGLFGHDLPAPWHSQQQLVRQYKSIFWQYRLFGDNAPLTGYAAGNFLIKVLSKVLRRPLPGWYDTHAKHASITDDPATLQSRG